MSLSSREPHDNDVKNIVFSKINLYNEGKIPNTEKKGKITWSKINVLCINIGVRGFCLLRSMNCKSENESRTDGCVVAVEETCSFPLSTSHARARGNVGFFPDDWGQASRTTVGNTPCTEFVELEARYQQAGERLC